MQTRKSHTDVDTDANDDTNRIRTKNNMSPSPSVEDIIYVIAWPTGQIEMESIQNTPTKKAYLSFKDFFSVVDVVL